jgi:hypothetical protein
MTDTGTFAAVAITLYAAHHVGDYWVQTDSQARLKGAAGAAGRQACTAHVLTYIATQAIFLVALVVALPWQHSLAAWHIPVAMLVSGLTHWTADPP